MQSQALTTKPVPSFLSLLSAHDHLSQLFLSHQEALIMDDFDLAMRRLRQFEIELRAHMTAEEELLLPVYARAGRILGGPLEFFIREHKKLLEFVESFHVGLDQLQSAASGLRRDLIELLDSEAAFKNLMKHHDERERNIFYPALDRVTSEDERRELIKRCGDMLSKAKL
ncbi:MAG TPA: hemerythrin domain-containing protein [Blastocatellia bacterium]|nr:hemerythrin domain-containing protein [Blastocatellia bacterium]